VASLAVSLTSDVMMSSPSLARSTTARRRQRPKCQRAEQDARSSARAIADKTDIDAPETSRQLQPV
jgi:hypothetical protein